MKLVVVTAGLTQPSSTRLLADRLAAATGRRLGGTAETPVVGTPVVETPVVETPVVELRDLAVDIANTFVTGFAGARLRTALQAVTEADGLIAVTPVFTASYSGLFKSFFDVLDNTALVGKPVLIAATGGTARHSLVLEHALRPLFAYLRAVVAPTAVYAASEDWGGGGDASADSLSGRVARAGAELADLMRARAPYLAERTPPPATHATTGGDGGGERLGETSAEEVVPFAEYLASLRP